MMIGREITRRGALRLSALAGLFTSVKLPERETASPGLRLLSGASMPPNVGNVADMEFRNALSRFLFHDVVRGTPGRDDECYDADIASMRSLSQYARARIQQVRDKDRRSFFKRLTGDSDTLW